MTRPGHPSRAVGWGAARVRLGRWLLPLVLLVVTGCPGPLEPRPPAVPPKPGRGEVLMSAYGCAGCHEIPGVPGTGGTIGPPLDGFARRSLIAGRVPNEPPWLEKWILDPQSIDPGTAMPALGVHPDHARDMAAYLRELQ